MPSAPEPAPALRDRAERHVFALLPELAAVERRLIALLELADADRAAAQAETGLGDIPLRFAAKRARKALRRTLAPLSAGARCERAELLHSDRLDGPLRREDRKWLEIHFARCPRCTEHAELLARARAELRATFAAAPPPAPAPPAVGPPEERALLRVVPAPPALEPPEEPLLLEPADEPAALEPAEESAALDAPEEPAALEPAEEPAALEPAEEPAALEPSPQPPVLEPADEPPVLEPADEPPPLDPPAEPPAIEAVEPPAIEGPPPAPPAPAPRARPPITPPPPLPAPRRGTSPAARRALRILAILVVLAGLVAGIGAAAAALDDHTVQHAPWDSPSAPEVRPAPLIDQ